MEDLLDHTDLPYELLALLLIRGTQVRETGLAYQIR
jgi:hypothetical protein